MNAHEKREWKATIAVKLMTDDKWLERAVLAIYNRQVRDEKTVEITKYTNGIGFTKGDAKKMTYYAKWILSGRHLNNFHREVAYKRMKKYIGQLVKVIEEKKS